MIVWKELKWPSNTVIKEGKKSINDMFLKRWRKMQRIGFKPLTLVVDLDETLIHSTNFPKTGSSEEPLIVRILGLREKLINSVNR